MRDEYNQYRPHSALGMLTPDDYANRWQTNQPRPLYRVDHFKGSSHAPYATRTSPG